MIDEGAPKIDDFSLTGPWGEDAASLPSFKPLPERSRADSRHADRPIAKPPERALPPLDLAPFRVPDPLPPHRVLGLRWRILRGLALLLVGSGIGAALVYPASNDRGTTEAKYYTVFPPAMPAVPPPEILYVDKWRMVAIDPFSLAEAAKSEQPAKVEPPQAATKAVEMFAPAMPIAPPPEIILVERGSTRQRPVAGMHPPPPARLTPPPARLSVPATAEPKKPEDAGDVLEQINRWFAGANRR